MSIHRKKSAVINSQVRIRNELSQVFVPNNNLGISINTTVPFNSTNTIATTNIIGNMPNKYYISLISSTTGSQTINTSTNLLYDISNDNLQLNNLSTTNPPTCSATPTQSNDLINKSYLNSFVGDYTQRWIYDDFINGSVYGSNLRWSYLTTTGTIITSDASGHIGIVRMTGTCELTGISLLMPTHSNVKSVRFLVNPFSNNTYNGTANIFIGLKQPNNNNILTANTSIGFYKDAANGWCYIMNNAKITTNVNYTLNNTLSSKWILFEIEINNNIPTFYITIEGETNRILACAPGYEITNIGSINPSIYITAGNIDIDYFDAKLIGLTRT
jgi:hypothetical protein